MEKAPEGNGREADRLSSRRSPRGAYLLTRGGRFSSEELDFSTESHAPRFEIARIGGPIAKVRGHAEDGGATGFPVVKSQRGL